MIQIQTPYITLQQLIKLADIAISGGQAKAFIQEAMIQVNGEEEHRRGRKLYPGDIVEINGQTYTIQHENS